MNPLLTAVAAEIESRWTAKIAHDPIPRPINPHRMRMAAVRAARAVIVEYASRPNRRHVPGKMPSDQLPVVGTATTAWLRDPDNRQLARRRQRALFLGDGAAVFDRPRLGDGRDPETVPTAVSRMLMWPYCGTDGWRIYCPRDQISARPPSTSPTGTAPSLTGREG